MNTPIQPTAPVNPVITIQPVNAAIGSHASSAGQNPLSNIASGTLVEGFVVNRDAQNNPILRTSIGDLRVTSEVFLKTGSEVVFKVDTTQASLARIVTVDGLTPHDYNQQNAPRGLTHDTVTSTALQSALGTLAPQAGKPLGTLAGAPLLQAIILQGSPPIPSLLTDALNAVHSGPALALAQLSQLRAGTPVRLTLLDLKLPALPLSLAAMPPSTNLDSILPPRPGAVAAQPSTPPPPPPAALASAEQGVRMPRPLPKMEVADESAPLLSRIEQRHVEAAIAQPSRAAEAPLMRPDLVAAYGKSMFTKPTPYSPPQHTASHDQPMARPAPPSIAPNQITANVIGHEADGANILHTPFATLKLYTPQPLPTGTTLVVSIEVETAAPSTATFPLTEQEKNFIGTATRDLKSLDDVLVWLQKNQPDIARDVQQRLPNVNHNLTSGLLFFVAALKAGDVAGLLGKRALRELERSAPELLSRLRSDSAQMQAAFIESPLTHWSTMMIPIMFGQELQQARLYISKEQPKEESTRSPHGNGQRFVLDVGLSQLGPMQFDGFVRGAERTKSFDLMVRTAQPLPEDISHTIREIFITSMEVTGMSGQVLFQPGEQHFVRPLAEAPPIIDRDSPNTILA